MAITLRLELGPIYRVSYPDGSHKDFQVLGGETLRIYDVSSGTFVDLVEISGFKSIEVISDSMA